MSNDFIPSRDANALLWMQAFSGGISASPSTYLLNSADAATIASAVAGFDSALSIASSPATRNKGTVEAKDLMRASAEAVCRQYAILIKYNAGISNQDKIDIGVRPVNTNREPVNCPQTVPILAVIASTPGAQTLRFSDSFTPDSPAKPFGAIELQLYRAVGAVPVTSYKEAAFYGKFTRNPVSVLFEPEDNGKMATYFARWASLRGEVSPFSAPVSLAIAA